jgi:uncharacterized protein (DUF58 family)
MLAPRGWWFLAIVFGGLFVAVAFGIGTLVVILMTLLTWFLATWVHFLWLTRLVPPKIEISRETRTPGGPVTVLWARQPATVRIEIRWTTGGTLPFVLAIDKAPALAKWSDGESWARGPLSRTMSLVIEYPIDCPAAGRLRFDGVKLIVTDLQGFFHRTVFLRQRTVVRVLPPLVEGPGGLPSRKRHNTLPLVGTHRLFRAGGGSELLDLRDYVPSDPPKLIAWKASARRDRLITKELESEVPVRCTLFLDASSSTRVGPVGRNALARLVEIAAGALYANSESRDLTGLVVFDEHGVGRCLRPARGRRAFFQTLHVLADVADEPPTVDQREVTHLLPLAMGLAQDVYPGWLGRDVNYTPWYSPRFWRRDNRWRKKIAAILANVYGLGTGGISLLYHEDEVCQRYLLRWFNDHRVAVPILLYDERGRYLFRAGGKIAFLARALTDSIARAKDNELFVLLADLFDADADRGPLLRAVKTARARRHQVQVICPWPPGVPIPDGREKPPPIFLAPNLQELLSRVWTSRLQQAFTDLRRDFGRIGVPTIAAPSQDSVAQIMERMQRLRPGARRVR